MARDISEYLPPIKEDGLYTAEPVSFGSTLAVTGAATFSSSLAVTGVVSGHKRPASVVTGDTTLTAALSGTTYIDTKGSATTTFSLPDAGTTQGISFTFICGNASGEILINPATGDAIKGKTHGAENGAGIAPAAGTGIKNTAATNVVGDFCTLVFDGVDTWWMTSVAGVWASQ